MKDKIMSAMQAFSKAMFMPVLILPIAGLLIAVGNVLTNARLLEMAPFWDVGLAIDIIPEKGGQCSFYCRFPLKSRFFKEF